MVLLLVECLSLFEPQPQGEYGRIILMVKGYNTHSSLLRMLLHYSKPAGTHRLKKNNFQTKPHCPIQMVRIHPATMSVKMISQKSRCRNRHLNPKVTQTMNISMFTQRKIVPTERILVPKSSQCWSSKISSSQLLQIYQVKLDYFLFH